MVVLVPYSIISMLLIVAYGVYKVLQLKVPYVLRQIDSTIIAIKKLKKTPMDVMRSREKDVEGLFQTHILEFEGFFGSFSNSD
jgi:hypothetical protein